MRSITALRLARRQQPRDRGSAKLFGRIARLGVAAGADHQQPAPAIAVEEGFDHRARFAVEPLALQRCFDGRLGRAEAIEARPARCRQTGATSAISPVGRVSAKRICMDFLEDRSSEVGALLRRVRRAWQRQALGPRRIAALGQGAIGRRPSSYETGRDLLAVRSIGLCWTALPLLLALPGTAWAQAQPRRRARRRDQPKPNRQIEFSADEVDLRQRRRHRHRAGPGADVARRQLSRRRPGRAGTARPARSSPRAMSSWSTPQGDKLVGERVDLTDTLRDGTVENLLVVLESGGRIAADGARRAPTTYDA